MSKRLYLPASILFMAIIALFFFAACTELWGKLDDPADPDSPNYQGFPTVGSVDDLTVVSPSSGGTLTGAILTVTPVAGASAYAVRIAASEENLGVTNLYEKSDYTTNVLDISAAPIADAATYYWQARATKDETNWGNWTEAATFATEFSTPAATPTFSPPGGTYASDQSVTISCATSGVPIYYTTNGDTPTTSSTPYTGAISVAGHGTTMTIKAIASGTGYLSSGVASATYTISYTAAATPTFSPPGGTYTSDQSVTLSCATSGATIYYTTNGDTPTTSSEPYTGAISVAGHGTTMTIKAIASGTGYLSSGVASAMYTISYTAAATPTFSPPGGTYASDQSVTISCATSGVPIYYTTNGSTPTTSSTPYTGDISVAGHGTTMTIKAIASGTGYTNSGVGNATYTISYPAAATPTFSPPSGPYTSDQSVTLSCATGGATIYYTTDGSTPTTSSTLYTGSITATVSGSGTTIKAIATAPLYSTSQVGSATYILPLLSMLSVSGGTFNNGTSDVTVSSFRMSKYEVTQAQYAMVTGNSPSYFTGDTSRPVEQVTWYEAVEFCNKLSEREGLENVYTISGRSPSSGYPIWSAIVTMDRSKSGYRLPTEAEWEFAARGGNSTHGYTYSGSNTVDDVAWYGYNSGSTTHAAGGKAANELGLYDMSGNVSEWCWDWYGNYPSESQTDPTGASSGTYRVNRGGIYSSNQSDCTVSFRNYYNPGDTHRGIGFRVVAP